MESRVALISGSTAGLGLDLAVKLARAGHAVAVNGRSPERVDAAVAHVETEVEGAKVHAAPADISDPDQVDAMVEAARGALGPIGMFVHSAVLRNERTLVETTNEVWNDNIGACLNGAFYCTRAVLPDMLERGWGRVIYFGGISTQLGSPGRAALIAAKNGLYGLTKAVSAEVGHRNVTVNAVSPGVIEDEPEAMPDDDRTERRRALVEGARIPRFGTTAEVNAMVLFLLGEEAGYITGQHLAVTGGLVPC